MDFSPSSTFNWKIDIYSSRTSLHVSLSLRVVLVTIHFYPQAGKAGVCCWDEADVPSPYWHWQHVFHNCCLIAVSRKHLKDKHKKVVRWFETFFRFVLPLNVMKGVLVCNLRQQLLVTISGSVLNPRSLEDKKRCTDTWEGKGGCQSDPTTVYFRHNLSDWHGIWHIQ